MEYLRDEYSDRFNKISKTNPADNNLNLTRLHELEQLTETKIYFAHPYFSSEKSTSERYNGLRSDSTLSQRDIQLVATEKNRFHRL